MSAHTAHPHDGHDAHESDAGHVTLKGYVIGFLLSVLLTAVPFWLVMGEKLDSSTTGYVIVGFAAVQVVVQMVYFLHMNTTAEGGWSLLALLFTLLMVFILMAGSLWVMYHLNNNMMPGMMIEPAAQVQDVQGMAGDHSMPQMHDKH